MTFYTYVHSRASDNKPFYVGKGKSKRAHDVVGRNRHWSSVVAKHGLKVNIAAEWPTEVEAFEHEKFLILCFRDMKMPLVNMTDGGEGLSGYKYSPEHRERQRISSTGRKHKQETRSKISEANKGRSFTNETLNRMSAAAKIRAATPEFIARNTGENNPMKRSEIAERSGAAQRGKKLTDEHKLKISIAGKGRIGANKGKTFGPDVRAKMSAAGKGRPKSEEHKRKISEANKAYAAKKKEASK